MGGIQTLISYPEKIENLAQRYAKRVQHQLATKNQVSEENSETVAGQTDLHMIDINTIEQQETRTVGTEHLLLHMVDQLQLKPKLRDLGLSQKEVALALGAIIGRAVFPASERATHEWGLSLYVSIEKRRGAKEEMIVVSNFQFDDPPRMYRRRWEIETMFGCLKTRGFRMEDTHITDPDKIEKVMFVLAIAFCWAYRIGDIQDQTQAIEMKTHGRRARSLFREGLNLIRRAIFGRWVLRKFRRLLSCFTYSESKGCAK